MKGRPFAHLKYYQRGYRSIYRSSKQETGFAACLYADAVGFDLWAIHGAIAVTLALYAREESGCGDVIEVSLVGCGDVCYGGYYAGCGG